MSQQAFASPRHVVVLAHPNADSFNASVVRTYCETACSCGQETIVRDLYAMDFNPVLTDDERPQKQGVRLSPDVEAELAVIRGADIYTFVYPIWFAMPPAMMIGYIDRVIGAGVTARAIQDRAGESVLSGQHMLNITSSATRDVWLDEQGQVQSLRTLVGDYLRNALAARSCEHLHLGGVVEGNSKRFVDQALYEVFERARKVCAMLAAERHAGSNRQFSADRS
ncbi:NAD(P)H-dependent oxidoreductase [Sphingomonas nostoxanthinifaciens]|uniref:NAD(P)H-dependent oxidoreductase n=1 Tax=Sphingomonas nostoxanthinifaciens TaxID=2872652 RepID=UPI001CC20C3F|nr:NAD(P)H-dependent oxidoreductase [Sphingomonas nostoxanthinifaciens]UAK23092.1 NAD(P)H-dependent oxidoreductase [Sphingomonas nostoxanthinifaciens]